MVNERIIGVTLEMSDERLNIVIGLSTKTGKTQGIKEYIRLKSYEILQKTTDSLRVEGEDLIMLGDFKWTYQIRQKRNRKPSRRVWSRRVKC